MPAASCTAWRDDLTGQLPNFKLIMMISPVSLQKNRSAYKLVTKQSNEHLSHFQPLAPPGRHMICNPYKGLVN
jgi:hypothetical protein